LDWSVSKFYIFVTRVNCYHWSKINPSYKYVEFRDTPMVKINPSYKYVEFRDTPMVTINTSYKSNGNN
jgi:hypothetical protein